VFHLVQIGSFLIMAAMYTYVHLIFLSIKLFFFLDFIL